MLDPSRHEIWKMFNALSPTYDRTNRVLSFGLDQRWRKRVARYLPVKGHLQILDLATGTADQLIALFENGASIQSAVGIDLAADMMALAQKKIDTKPYKTKVELIEADAQKLPFLDGRFDAVTCSFGIRNVPSPLTALQEAHRVLRPLGHCLILEFSLPKRPIRWAYLLYLRFLLPQIGAWLSNDPAAYRYLNRTIEGFPSGTAFCALMQQAGFKKVRAHSMALGGVALYVGEKDLLA